MKKIQLKKGQIIQTKGELNSKVYQVESGLLRSYSIDEKGKEHIFMFASEGWIIADNAGPEEPSELFIDVLEDAVVFTSEKELHSTHDLPKLLKRVGVMQKRIIMLMSASAIERYEHFLETYPDIVQRVPQRMIASYLGITPEALSTLKRSSYQKK